MLTFHILRTCLFSSFCFLANMSNFHLMRACLFLLFFSYLIMKKTTQLFYLAIGWLCIYTVTYSTYLWPLYLLLTFIQLSGPWVVEFIRRAI